MATDNADFQRARTPLPRRRLTASSFEARSSLFNNVLAETGGLDTRACEDLSLSEVMAARELFVSAASGDLNTIYGIAGRRQLSSFLRTSTLAP